MRNTRCRNTEEGEATAYPAAQHTQGPVRQGIPDTDWRTQLHSSRGAVERDHGGTHPAPITQSELVLYGTPNGGSTNIAKLTEIHSDIATQYAGIMCKVDYVDVTPPVARPSQSTAIPPSRSKYQPNPTFLEQGIGVSLGTPPQVTSCPNQTSPL